MNYIDIIIAGVVGYFLYWGMKKGLIKTLAGIIGLFAALFIATTFMNVIADFLRVSLHFNKVFSYVFSYLALFVGTIFIFRFTANLIVKLFTVTSTRWIDRAGGGVFGFLLGSMIISAFFVFFSYFTITEKLLPERDSSMLYPYALSFFPAAYDIISDLGPVAKKFRDISEDILKDEPKEILERTHAGRDILKE